LLDTTQTRNLLIDELLELQGFLRQRIIEMKSDSDVLSANQVTYKSLYTVIFYM